MTGRLNFTPLDAYAMMRIRAEGRFEIWRRAMTLGIAQYLARYPGRMAWHNGVPLVAGGVRPHDHFRSIGLVWMVAAPDVTPRDYVQITYAWRLIAAIAAQSGFTTLTALGAADWPATQRWLPKLGFHRVGQRYIPVPGKPGVTEFFEYERRLNREAAHVH